MSENLYLAGFALIFGLVGAVPGFLLLRFGRWGGFAAMLAALVLIFAYLIFQGLAAPSGWDAIGYGIAAALMVLPAAVGGLIGGGLGHWARKRKLDGSA